MNKLRKIPKSREGIMPSLDCAGELQTLKELEDIQINKALALDQFFTKKYVADKLFKITKNYLNKEKISFDFWLEPSAGNGAFYSLMPKNKLAYDIDKKISGVIEKDFLSVKLDPIKKYVALGNPPFGKNSSLAIKFFNHCAKYCSVIAFIVPKTFKKSSVVSKLDKSFSLVLEEEIEENSFTLEGSDKLVPCVFQIWTKSQTHREKSAKVLTHSDLVFTDKKNATFAFQRVGVNAGRIKPPEVFANISSESHFFISSKVNHIEAILNSINWNCIKFNTAGNPSISKSELIEQYTKINGSVLYTQEKLLLIKNTNKIVNADENKELKLVYCDNLFIISANFTPGDVLFDDSSLTIAVKCINYTFKDKAKYLSFKRLSSLK